MTALGIVAKPGAQPKVTCVHMEGTVERPHVLGRFDLKSSEKQLVDQIDHLGKALGSKLTGFDVDVIVIRIADRSTVATRRSGSGSRLLLEGALAFVCRSKIEHVVLRTGKDVGSSLGMSKAQAEGRGKELDPTAPEAAAAALSGLETSVV
jgi:hypothetical protein